MESKKKQEKNNPLQQQENGEVIDDKKKELTTTTTKFDYNILCKKLIKEEGKEIKSFPRLNKIFQDKMKKRNSEICFWHRWIMKENYKGNIIIIERFRKENPSYSRSTCYDWINWLMIYKFLIKRKGTNEFMPSENYLKCLQQNALEIIKRCDELTQEKFR